MLLQLIVWLWTKLLLMLMQLLKQLLVLLLLVGWLWTKLMTRTKQDRRPRGPPSPSLPMLNLVLAR